MIRLIKERDTNNLFDNFDLEIKTNAETLEEILECFENFLKGMGFVINVDQYLDLISDKEPESKEEIEVNLNDEAFLMIAKRAHELDITFNEMCNIILKEELGKLDTN